MIQRLFVAAIGCLLIASCTAKKKKYSTLAEYGMKGKVKTSIYYVHNKITEKGGDYQYDSAEYLIKTVRHFNETGTLTKQEQTLNVPNGTTYHFGTEFSADKDNRIIGEKRTRNNEDDGIATIQWTSDTTYEQTEIDAANRKKTFGKMYLLKNYRQRGTMVLFYDSLGNVIRRDSNNQLFDDEFGPPTRIIQYDLVKGTSTTTLLKVLKKDSHGNPVKVLRTVDGKPQQLSVYEWEYY